HQGVVTENADELDHPGITQKLMDAGIGLVADALRLIELLNKSMNCALVFRSSGGSAPGLEIVDGACADAGAFGDGGVCVPFILCAPLPCRDQDREFREPRRQRGLVAT